MVICRKCFKEIPDGAPFCPWCGSRQNVCTHKRGNGLGTVYKRGDTWTVEVNRYVGDVRFRKKVGGYKTKKEAVMDIPRVIGLMGSSHAETISFIELWDRLQKTERYASLSDGKKTQWRIAYKRCASLHSERDFRKIRYEQMQECVRGLSFYPARDVKVLLNAMCSLALKSDWADKNFAELIELPKLEAGEKVIFTDEQLEVLWENQTVPGVDWILLMIYCGLRPIELRKLVPEMINLEDRYMMAGQKTEHSKQSPIAIPYRLMPIAADIKEHGVPKMSEEKLTEKFYRALAICGIQREDEHTLTPVCCRHTYVTLLSRTGANAATIQKAARHTKYQTTLGYTHMDISDVLDAVDALPPGYHHDA